MRHNKLFFFSSKWQQNKAVVPWDYYSHSHYKTKCTQGTFYQLDNIITITFDIYI